KLVDAPDLGSGAARCESSSLSFRTIIRNPALLGFFFFTRCDIPVAHIFHFNIIQAKKIQP
ncbi:hypothetical protein L9W84_11315, partial [Vibrio aestuarianus]